MTKVQLLKSIRSCTACTLRASCKAPVPAQFPSPTAGDPTQGYGNNGIFFLGEGPGQMEDSFGSPFVGKSGELLEHALSRAHLHRAQCMMSNVVRCRPAGGDGAALGGEEIARCHRWTVAEMEWFLADWESKDRGGVLPVLVTLGAVAFGVMRDTLESEVEECATLQEYRGVPVLATWHSANGDRTGVVWLALNHPALALRLPGEVTAIFEGIRQLRDREEMTDRAAQRNLRRLDDTRHGMGRFIPPGQSMGKRDVATTAHLHSVSIDTETISDADDDDGDRVGSRPWSVQIKMSDEGGAGPTLFMPLEGEPSGTTRRSLRAAIGRVGDKGGVVLHNAMFDLAVLRRAGVDLTDPEVYDGQLHDSMLAADVMQTEPRGLKLLGLRRGGVRMKDYRAVVGPTSRKMALDYLAKVVSTAQTPAGKKWGNKFPELGVDPKTGGDLWKMGQSIVQRVARLVKDLEDPQKAGSVDVRERWEALPAGQRREVAKVLGPMPAASLADVPFEEALHYSCLDAEMTARVWRSLWSDLCLPENKGLKETYLLDMSVLPLVVQMERSGLLVDHAALNEAEVKFRARMAEIDAEIESIAGRPVNLGSPKQTAWLIFDFLKIPEFKEKDPSLRRTTNDKWMEKITDLSPVILLIQEWRELQKLCSSYIVPVREGAKRHADGRLRSRLSPTGTETGRMTAKDPNVLSIPARSKLGKMIKRAFIASPGRVIINADYSQVELRLFAHETQEPTLLKAYREGLDMHRATAARGYKCAEAEVSDEMRSHGKTLNFGIIYGIAADGLSRQLGCSKGEAQRFIDNYFAGYTRVKPWMRDVIDDVDRKGYAEDMFGRRRHLGGMWSPDKTARGEAERQACNAKIQMAASGVIKRAMKGMIGVVRDFNRRLPGGVLPLLQVHDALVFEVDERLAGEFAIALRKVMEGVVKLSVPLVADVSVGPNWADQTKIEFEKKEGK